VGNKKLPATKCDEEQEQQMGDQELLKRRNVVGCGISILVVVVDGI